MLCFFASLRSATSAAAVLIVCVLGCGLAPAAELRLRSQCRTRGAMVTLGDVAEVFAADAREAEALAAMELFPSPSGSRQRWVRLREIQDLLLSRGVNLAKHRFSGSSQVAVAGLETVSAKRQLPPSDSDAARAEYRIRQAVLEHIGPQHFDQSESPMAAGAWIVQTDLAPDQVRLIADPRNRIWLGGGAAPWTGRQRLEVTVQTRGGQVRFPLQAVVSAPPATVVAARLLPRGTILRAADLEFRRDLPQEKLARGFSLIEEVIGKEVTQAIAEGKMVESKMVRSPLLVRRRDVVTVAARNGGILVRTYARARDDGSLGDLIAVESLQNREAYFARVSGTREVEVYARSVRAPDPAVGTAGGTGRTLRR